LKLNGTHTHGFHRAVVEVSLLIRDATQWGWWLVTNVLGEPNSPVFKGKGKMQLTGCPLMSVTIIYTT